MYDNINVTNKDKNNNRIKKEDKKIIVHCMNDTRFYDEKKKKTSISTHLPGPQRGCKLNIENSAK